MLISTLFAGASTATYAGYKNLEDNVQFAAAFSGISSLAKQALENGSSHASMLLPDSTISCTAGLLGFVSGTRTVTDFLQIGCNFTAVISGGIHWIKFSCESSTLTIQVN
jgi:hypothetical protein